VSIGDFVKAALAEDVGRGDLFEKTVQKTPYTANIISKQDGVFAGAAYGRALLRLFGIGYEFFVDDGESIKKGDRLLSVSGFNTDILKIERTLLNMLQHASGIATKGALFCKLADGKAAVLDTRKTRPMLRVFEKYAARCGGVKNHRFGLDDTLMLKDTHLKSISDLEGYLANAKKALPFTAKIEIECEDVESAKTAMGLGFDIVMCDNMDVVSVKSVVAHKKMYNYSTLIECSGNIDESNIAEYASSGVDAISIGSIIHQAVWLDFSMKGV